MSDEVFSDEGNVKGSQVEVEAKVLSWRFSAGLNELFDSITIKNNGLGVVSDASLNIFSEPKFFEDLTIPLEDIKSGDFESVRDFSSISYDTLALAELSERQDSLVTVSVEANGTVLAKSELVIERVPLNIWLKGDETESLARFFTPKETVALRLSQRANKEGGSLADKFNIIYDGAREFALKKCSLTPYISGNNAANSDYTTLEGKGREDGEVVRFGSDLTLSGEATVVEAAVMLGSALMGVKGKPFIVSAYNTIYLGLWDNSGDSILDTLPPSLLNATKEERPLFIDVSVLLDGYSFDEAVKSADEFFNLVSKKSENVIDFCLNVAVSQRRGMRPFPVLEGQSGETRIDFDKLFSIQVEADEFFEKAAENSVPLTRYQRWQHDILDLSPQNPLISFKLGASNVSIAAQSLEEVEDAISRDMRLNVTPFFASDGSGSKAELNATALKKVSGALKTQNILYALHEEKDLSNRLTSLYRAAKKTIEETGANALYLAVGFIKWLDTKCTAAKNRKSGAVERISPILLLPVELTRRSVKSGYVLRSRGEEAQVNMSLAQNFRLNYDLDFGGLNNLPRGEFGLDVTRVIEFVRQAIMGRKGWQVEDKVSLGLFRFSRFAMFSELNERENEIKEHLVVKSILNSRLEKELSLLDSTVKDEELKAKDEETEQKNTIYLPLDADGSQLKAIEDALYGRSFVMHGPPGTGKSQTIANIIANCLAHNKRVLFISEKSAALDVVYSRLERLGLADFCFELHSNKTSKKNALFQLEKSLKIAESVMEVNYFEAANREEQAAEGLNRFAQVLHKPTANGFSIYESMERFFEASSKVENVKFNVNIASKLLNKQTFLRGLSALEELKLCAKVFEEPKYSPFYYAEYIKTDAKFKEQLSKVSSEVVRLYVPFSRTIEQFLTDLEDENGTTYQDVSYFGLNALVKMIGNAFSFANSNGFKRMFISGKKNLYFKRLVALCKNDVDEYSKRLDCIRQFFKAEAAFRETIGLKKVKLAIKNGNGLFKVRDYSRTLAQAARLMNSGMSLIKEHRELKKALEKAEGLPVSATAARQYYEGVVDSQSLLDCFKKNFFAAYVENAIEAEPILREFLYSKQDHAVTEFAALKELTRELSATEIYKLAASRVPSIPQTAVSSSDPSILLKAIKNGCRDMPLRQLFEKIPQLITSLKPIMLMSPLSAAEFLPSSFPKFDIVIYDEASQLVTGEAVGSISRGKSAIIAGDPKQLPPTTFFKSQNLEQEEDFGQDLESMLDDVLVLNLPSHHLKWHYRSTHESLITFSNHCYYDSSLVTFPSFDDSHSKVRLVECDGIYDRGATRTNKVEAEKIVDKICQLIKDGEQSIGVIAFNVSQAELIEDLIDARLKNDSKLEEAFNFMTEPLFVKNLENVQGDERDIILFSICFGLDKNNKMPLNFGPINKDGGHRRLNVALTRSRKEMIVFNSIPFDKMRVGKSTVRGVKDLFSFLSYAKTGIVDEGLVNESSLAKNAKMTKSELTEAIAKGLQSLGLEVKTNVGRSQNKVDIAVLRPNDDEKMYSLGIILDTKAHSSIEYARDREILKEAMLKRLGWRTMRVYAVEFWDDPLKVLERIKRAVNEEGQDGRESEVEQLKMQILSSHGEAVRIEAKVEKTAEPYQSVTLNEYKSNLFFDSTYLHIIVAQLKEIIAVEAPISLDVLLRKVNSSWGFDRLSEQNKQYLLKALKSVNHYENDTADTVFVWLSRSQCQSYDIWRSNLDKSRSQDKICKEEYASAMHTILCSSMSANEDDLMRATAQEFSLIRSPSLNLRLGFALQLLTERGKVYIDANGKVRV